MEIENYIFSEQNSYCPIETHYCFMMITMIMFAIMFTKYYGDRWMISFDI